LANTKSAKKMIRVAARRQARNQPIRAALKTKIKTANSLISSNDGQAPESVLTAISALDKAAGRGIIHHNSAARRKSRLMRKLNKVAAA
jgi:small subunit ribosomal protein S20